ncbi:YqhR family membrane protein [Paenibacillus allorhizosphaerae]|nr:YqhR family membrane protein [Paenibacillus allorhizosphaerae]
MLRNGKEEKPHTNKWNFAVYIGFFAGFIWGGIKMIENYFHLTSLSPGFLIEPFFLHHYLMTAHGYIMGWLAYIVMSVIAALLYAVFLAKAKGPWVGIVYGLVWWGVIFLLIGPVSGMTNWIGIMDWNTIITELCLFVVWGLFIGYSISFEFTDERIREPYKKTAK